MTAGSTDAEAAKAAKAEKADETSTPSGGRTASEFRDIADQLRSRVDLFGKTLAAVATLGTTAVGLTKIGDLFPAAGWDVAWVIGASLGLAAAALAAIGVAARLMKVARPIFMDDDLKTMKDDGEIDESEKKAIEPVYAATAKRFGYSSLVALRGRERSLRDAASKAIDKDERARRTALADDVKSEIEQAFARGQVVVIRRRATNAVTDGLAWFLYAVVIAGLLLFAIGADKVSSDRKEQTAAQAKACADARKAGATAAEMGRTKSCDKTAAAAPAKPEQPSAAGARAQLIAKLASALEACTALVGTDSSGQSGPLTDADCKPLLDAISAMTH